MLTGSKDIPMASVIPLAEKNQTVNQLCNTEARWFAVYTRYKREKLVHKELQRKGITTYLPLLTLTRYYTRKVKTVHLPLISCYLFVKITRRQYVPVLETSDVVQFVRFKRDLIAIPEREIDILRMVCGEQVPVEVTQEHMGPGDRVEIIGGRLTGLQGVLRQQSGKKRFIVELDTVGIQLAMEVPNNLLQKVRKQ